MNEHDPIKWMSEDDRNTILADQALVAILRLLVAQGRGAVLGRFDDGPVVRLVHPHGVESIESNTKEWALMAAADPDEEDETGRSLRLAAMKGMRDGIDLYWEVADALGPRALKREAEGRYPRPMRQGIRP